MSFPGLPYSLVQHCKLPVVSSLTTAPTPLERLLQVVSTLQSRLVAVPPPFSLSEHLQTTPSSTSAHRSVQMAYHFNHLTKRVVAVVCHDGRTLQLVTHDEALPGLAHVAREEFSATPAAEEGSDAKKGNAMPAAPVSPVRLPRAGVQLLLSLLDWEWVVKTHHTTSSWLDLALELFEGCSCAEQTDCVLQTSADKVVRFLNAVYVAHATVRQWN